MSVLSDFWFAIQHYDDCLEATVNYLKRNAGNLQVLRASSKAQKFSERATHPPQLFSQEVKVVKYERMKFSITAIYI